MALPLGIATTMASLNLNMPRYFIHTRLGEHQLGIFSAMAYATMAMILVTDSLGHCAIPRLSRLYTAGRMAEFRSLLLRLLAVGGGVGLAGLTVVHVMGARLLTLIYGREYAAHYRIFRVLILATAIHCVACMFTSAVTSARCFGIQVPLYTLVVGSNALACARWVSDGGNDRRRRGHGCGSDGAIGAGRRSREPLALVTRRTSSVPTGAATLRCRLGSEHMICLSVLQRCAGYAIITCQPMVFHCRCLCRRSLSSASEAEVLADVNQ